jgi:hypothetical protein
MVELQPLRIANCSQAPVISLSAAMKAPAYRFGKRRSIKHQYHPEHLASPAPAPVFSDKTVSIINQQSEISFFSFP